MSTMYGADVAQLRALAQQFDRCATQLDADRATVGSVIRIQAWMGPIAVAFRLHWDNDLSRRVGDAARRLREGAHSLRANAQEQEGASAADGTAALSPAQRWADEHPADRRGPSHARDFVRELANQDGQDGVRIQKIRGEDGVSRYVVYVNGSGSASNGNLGWLNNLAVAEGLPTPTLLRIIAQIREAVDPPSAEVAIIGFSQGGMIAQQIADSGAVNTKVVMTFGSPIEPAYNDYGGADVIRLVHGGFDPVPHVPTLLGPSTVAALLTGGSDSTFVAGLPTATISPTGGIEPHLSHDVDDYEWVAEQFDKSAAYATGRRALARFGGTVIADDT